VSKWDLTSRSANTVLIGHLLSMYFKAIDCTVTNNRSHAIKKIHKNTKNGLPENISTSCFWQYHPEKHKTCNEITVVVTTL